MKTWKVICKLDNDLYPTPGRIHKIDPELSFNALGTIFKFSTRIWGCNSVVESLPIMWKILGSTPRRRKEGRTHFIESFVLEESWDRSQNYSNRIKTVFSAANSRLIFIKHKFLQKKKKKTCLYNSLYLYLSLTCLVPTNNNKASQDKEYLEGQIQKLWHIFISFKLFHPNHKRL